MLKMPVLMFMLCVSAVWANSSDSPYGVCAHVCKQDQWKLAEPKFSLIRPAGIRWVRNGFTWAQAEPTPGVWDFSKFDIVAETARRHNIDFLPILAIPPSWGRPVIQHLDGWRDYVRRTVSRYHKQFKVWEIWNEANLKDDNYLTAKDYTAVLKASWEEIKAIDPSLQVTFTGASGVPCQYIEQCLDLGAGEYFDIMNIHPYTEKIPEAADEQLQPLFELFARRNISKPIWVTEFSWATNLRDMVFKKDVLEEGLKQFGLSCSTARVAIIRNHGLEAVKGEHTCPQDYTEGIFPNRKEISYEDLKTLDPSEYHVLVPTLTQAFPRTYFKYIVDYVRRGGIILHSNGFPFYCDARQDEAGIWQQIPDSQEALLKQLHIKWLAAWRDPVPKSGTASVAPGLNLPKLIGGGGERYLSEEYLQKGDRLIPLYIQTCKNGFCAPTVGVFKFDSDLKGGAIVDVNFNATGHVTEEIQGQFLPRAILLFLSRGIKKTFWYKLRAEERSPYGIGFHFGIVHKDFTPRDAFTAYATLIEKCPEGSSRPALSIDGQICHAEWKRPDGKTIHAFWTKNGSASFKLPKKPTKLTTHLGKQLPLQQQITLSTAIVYAEGLE